MTAAVAQPEPAADTAEAQLITALDDAVNYTVKHPLEHKWALWYDMVSKSKAAHASGNWMDNLKMLVVLSTVEDYWGVMNNVLPCSMMPGGSNYHFFKDGVKPGWEDPANKDGGKWSFEFERDDVDSFVEAWQNILLAMIGEDFGPNNGIICGAVSSVRARHNRIAVWIGESISETTPPSDPKYGRVKAVGEKLRELMGLGPRQELSHVSHRDSAETVGRRVPVSLKI